MSDPNYSFLDRAVHRLAFNTSFGQQILCDLEMRLYGEEIMRQPVDNPIFVTALPRAGTTLLLELLSKHPDTVTHNYRDMPFVLSPIVWRRLSGRFQVDLARSERSHGDGMMVDVDSPEAFEEVFWLKTFPEMFGNSGIEPFHEDGREIRAPLMSLIRRLVASRADPAVRAPRYLSKNNANIARVSALKSAFPDARFLVPLRAPLDHAMSLHRQHLRYVKIHAESGFTQSYMRDIGHFEFGALHRPVLFDGMQAVQDRYDPLNLEYWVGYWTCAHRHLATLSSILFLDMKRFTSEPNVQFLLAELDLREDSATIDAAKQLIRPIRQYERRGGVPDTLLDTAESLFEEIRFRACVL